MSKGETIIVGNKLYMRCSLCGKYVKYKTFFGTLHICTNEPYTPTTSSPNTNPPKGGSGAYTKNISITGTIIPKTFVFSDDLF